MQFSIQKQTQAEKDQFLFDCFHDTGAINELLKGKFSILAGRKGAGKTALARYLQRKYNDFNLDYSDRISTNDIIGYGDRAGVEGTETIALYILVWTIRLLIKTPLIMDRYVQYWKDFLEQNNFQSVNDYRSFQELSRKRQSSFSIRNIVGGSIESEYRKCEISNLSSYICFSLRESLVPEKDVVIFIDDISDHLDRVSKENLELDLDVIRDLLFKLDSINDIFVNSGIGLRYVSCIREDLFDFMNGSNINKLKSNTLNLIWDEVSFCSLLIRRLPFFQDNLEWSLINPIEAIKQQFPDEIFQGILRKFATNRHATNFYSYMVGISFNRPRDFLMYCYALRERLSFRHIATAENIDSAEGEYVDYFMAEIKDELYLASQLLEFKSDADSLNKLINILAQSDLGFNVGKLKTDISTYLETKTSTGNKKIQHFIFELWWYGLIGFKKRGTDLINFRYLKKFIQYIPDDVKNYTFYLHRGLWWFLRKRK